MNRPTPSATAQPVATSYGFCGVEVMWGSPFGAAVNVSRLAVSINRYVLLVQVGDSRHRQEDGRLVGSNRPSAGVLSDTFLPVPDWPQNGTTLALIPPLITGESDGSGNSQQSCPERQPNGPDPEGGHAHESFCRFPTGR